MVVLCVGLCLRGQDHGLGLGSQFFMDGPLPGGLLRPVKRLAGLSQASSQSMEAKYLLVVS